MAELKVKELDFDLLKEQFVEFLKTQTQFKDFDYAGSNMNVLLDVLAYNTYQNGFQTNMAINEMFLDSAKIPTSIASHAKTLNYTPKSMLGATAHLDIRLESNSNLSFLTLPAYTKFTSSASGKTYSFYTTEPIVFNREDGVYRQTIPVKEGKIMEETFYVRKENPTFELSRPDIDISTVKVTVEDSNGIFTIWDYAPNLYAIEAESKVFYLQTSNLETYQLYFGKSNFGMPPSIGSKVRVTYLYTSGEEANGVSKFRAPVGTGDISSITVMSVQSPARYGADRESVSSIKYNAPKANQVQRRAIVESDYRTVILERFPQVRAVAAIGGEKLTPPEYGKVAVIVDMAGIDGVPKALASEMETFLKSRCAITVDPVVRSAEFAYVAVSTNVKFDVENSSETLTDIRSFVMENILKYSDDNLEDFGKTLRLSKLQNYIDNSHSRIISNNTIVRPILEIYPEQNKDNAFKISFGSRIVPQAEQSLRSISGIVSGHPVIPDLRSTRWEQIPGITSSSFLVGNDMCYITDDGYGELNIIKEVNNSNIVVEKNIGSVDYDTGTLIINSLRISRSQDELIKIYAKMADGDVPSPQGTIIKIRKEDVNIEVGRA